MTLSSDPSSPTTSDGRPPWLTDRLRYSMIAALLVVLLLLFVLLGGVAEAAAAFFGVPLLLTAIAVYCLPAVIADRRDHPQRRALTLLNILAGWTVLGWVGALVWAVMPAAFSRPTAPPDSVPVEIREPSGQGPDAIESSFAKLQTLMADGYISESEYEAKRAELLSRL